MSASDILATASAEVGYTEQGGPDGRSGNLTKYGKAYGLDGQPWCSIFVWWVFAQRGINLRKAVADSYAYCPAALNGFHAKGWQAGDPRPGDVVFFHFPGEAAGADHTGIVVSVDADGSVHTIEGNTSSGDAGSQSNGGQVARKHRPRSACIGFGRFPFPPVKPAGDRLLGIANPPMTGDDVRGVQHALNVAGNHLAEDGVYGRSTADLVATFQQNRGIDERGVGPKTWAALRAVVHP